MAILNNYSATREEVASIDDGACKLHTFTGSTRGKRIGLEPRTRHAFLEPRFAPHSQLWYMEKPPDQASVGLKQPPTTPPGYLRETRYTVSRGTVQRFIFEQVRVANANLRCVNEWLHREVSSINTTYYNFRGEYSLEYNSSTSDSDSHYHLVRTGSNRE
ncbi:hypothetical protein PIB30_090383 [Stylosanthes scabra]|uniref:Uncharacterized protein n=1 Tax=Stylosanthes scabra TaxID=79078 RepID=A0ABU6UTP9_9FABA|nr:hypothetical protein [Stylosanthes scabra]